MRAEIIARNYAETLLALAERHGGAGGLEQFGQAADALGDLLRADPRLRQFLETPRVTADDKKAVLQRALAGRAPEMFVRFVMVLTDKRRQSLLPEIAAAYRDLVDARMGRVRVNVTISHAPDAELQAEIGNALADRLGKTVIPTFTVDPELLGGLVVRMGDQILARSVRSRAAQLRRRMLAASLPAAAPAEPAAV
jgi:F-type H+-transporting ATPase subunit delta